MRLLRERVDARGLFEAFGAEAADEAAWASTCLNEAARLFTTERIVILLFQHEGGFLESLSLRTFGVSWPLDMYRAERHRVGPNFDRLMATVWSSHLTVLDAALAADRFGVPRQELHDATGMRYIGGIPVVAKPGTHVMFAWGSADDSRRVSRADGRLLRRLGLHLGNGVALRETAAVDGDVPADGATPGERGREVWEALCVGRVSLARRGTSYKLIPLGALDRWRHSLTQLERTVLERCAAGASAKEVALDLALQPSTLSHLLAWAASKLGCPSTLDALRLVGGLLRPTGVSLSTLTAAERDVVQLVRMGMSNQDIARHRGRSVRTVANQVAAILKKTSVSGRRALIALAR